MLTDKQKEYCLRCNPFEGDFGAPGDVVLKDKIVVARKQCKCGCCYQNILPKTHARKLSAIFDGKIMNYSWCEECCIAMANVWTDNGLSWEERVRSGNKERYK